MGATQHTLVYPFPHLCHGVRGASYMDMCVSRLCAGIYGSDTHSCLSFSAPVSRCEDIALHPQCTVWARHARGVRPAPHMCAGSALRARVRPVAGGRVRAIATADRADACAQLRTARPPCCGTGRDTHVASALLRTCARGAHCALGANTHVSALSRTCVRKAPHSVGASLAEQCTCPPCPAPMSGERFALSHGISGQDTYVSGLSSTGKRFCRGEGGGSHGPPWR
jgi:hypothetical protein